MNIMELSDFIEQLKDFAKEHGAEIKTDKNGVALWPTYDNQTGGIGEWFCLYIKPVKTQEDSECR